MTEEPNNAGAPECGRLLRRAREGLGLSEDDVAEELRLSPFQIRALEEDDWEHLPGSTYARGYLRSYARLLNLDVDKLLAGATTQELEISPDARPTQGPRDEPEGGRAKRSSGGLVRAGVAVVALVAVLAAYLWQSEEASQFLSGLIGGPSNTGEDVAQPLYDDTGGNIVEDVEGLSTNAGGATGQGTLPEGWARVALEFQESSWVDLRDARGERLLYRSFQPGRRVATEGRPPFHLYLGNARAVEIEYAGRPIEPEIQPGRLFARFVLGAPDS